MRAPHDAFLRKVLVRLSHNPEGSILGISKIGRVIDYCAARLQVQERLAQDVVMMIVDALGKEHPPLAVGIIMEGEHLCKSMRGVKKAGKMHSSFYFVMESCLNEG